MKSIGLAVIGALVFLVISGEVGTSDGTENNLLSQIAQTVKKLQDIKVAPSDANIPPPAIPLLRELKQRLRDLIAVTLNASTVAGEEPDAAKQMIIDALGRKGIRMEFPRESKRGSYQRLSGYKSPYGNIYSIAIEKPVPNDDIIAATATIGINCGEDTSLWLFKKSGSLWVCIFINEVNDYSDISAAQANFTYRIVPSDKRDHINVVTANITPWCSSWWRKIRYIVQQVTVREEKSRTLLNESDDIYLGVDPKFYTLTAGTNYFVLKYYGGRIDGPLTALPPQVTKAFEIKNGNIKRIEAK